METLVLEMHFGEWEGECPDYCMVSVDAAFTAKLKRLLEGCRALGVDSLSLYDYSPQYLEHDWESNETALVPWHGGVDGARLVITPHYFFWEGYLKHKNALWSTDRSDAEEFLVEHTSFEELPFLVSIVTTDNAKAKLRERLSS